MALPQIIHIIRSRTTAGVSMVLWQVNSGAIIAWTLHGIYTMRANLIAPNAVLGISCLVLVFLIWRDRRPSVLSTVAPILALAAGLTAIELTLGEFTFGVAAAVPTLIGLLAQLKDLLVREDVRGVSAGMLAMTVAQQGLWVTWAIFSGDRAVLASASILTLASVLNLAVLLLRLSGRLQARARVVTSGADEGESG